MIILFCLSRFRLISYFSSVSSIFLACDIRINGSILVGGAVAASLSLLTYFQRESVLRGLTTDAGIREASKVIFPAVLVTQGEIYNCSKTSEINGYGKVAWILADVCRLRTFTVLKGLAYPVNGIIMGGLDWKFTMAGKCVLL